MYYTFYVNSTDSNELEYYMNNLSTIVDGLGFLLDIPMSWGFVRNIKETKCLYNSESLKDHYIFERVDFHYHDKKTEWINPTLINLKRIQIENFINELNNNQTLYSAVYHYLQAIEEANTFFSSLYKAYELLKPIKYMSGKSISFFTRIANDPRNPIGRHTSNSTKEIHSYSINELNRCQNVIKNAIAGFYEKSTGSKLDYYLIPE